MVFPVHLAIKGYIVELDPRQLAQIVLRRGWLIVLVMAIAGLTAFVVSARQDPQYSATSTLLVVPGQTVGSNELSALQASRSIAETYRLLIETGPVLDRVIDRLNLPYDAIELEERISTAIAGETQIVEVSAIDGDPEQAALIANTLVEEFQLHLREQLDAHIATTRAVLDTQIVELEERRTDISTEIDELQAGANSEDVAIQRQLDFLVDDLGRVDQSLADIQMTALTINTDIVALSAQVEFADPARVPEEPFAPRVLFTTVVGLLLGLMIGVALVALLEFLDNTVKPNQNVQALVRAPMLTTVSQLPKLPPGPSQVYALSQPRSSATEAMRLLRTNLEFASASGDIDKLVITSPGPGEGKSTVTANLGVVMAQAGVKTLIIDADLRKPTQHLIFDVQNDRGLTTLITHPDQSWKDVVKHVGIANLQLISSGPLPPNPSDLVSSLRFTQLLARVQQDVDLILIDSPPILSASDSLAVAIHTDGVILVCQSNKTRIDALHQAAHALHQGEIRIAGVVLNRLKGRHGAYYGSYYGGEPGGDNNPVRQSSAAE